MNSQRKIDANRRNCLRSTGPRTPEGKARSAGNALRHGAWSARVLEPDRDSRECRQYRRGMLLRLRPRGEEERHLAEKAILHGWRLQRVHELEAALYCRDQAEAADALERGGPLPPPGRARQLAFSIALGEVLGRTMAGPRSPYTTLSLLEARTWRNYAACMERLRGLQAQRRRLERLPTAASAPTQACAAGLQPRRAEFEHAVQVPRIEKSAGTKPPSSAPLIERQPIVITRGYAPQAPAPRWPGGAQNEATIDHLCAAGLEPRRAASGAIGDPQDEAVANAPPRGGRMPPIPMEAAT